MTKNAWDTDLLNANGEVLIGSGTSSPVSATISSGTNCTVVNGANSIQLTYTGSKSGDWVLTHSASASASSELTFTGLSSTYFAYVFVIDNYVPDVDGERLAFQLSVDNGSTWDSVSTYYFRAWLTSGGSTASGEANGSSSNFVGSGSAAPGNGTNESSSSVTWVWNPSAVAYTRVTNICSVIDQATDPAIVSIQSGRENATAINAVRLFNAGADITTAEVRVYGVLSA